MLHSSLPIFILFFILNLLLFPSFHARHHTHYDEWPTKAYNIAKVFAPTIILILTRRVNIGKKVNFIKHLNKQKFSVVFVEDQVDENSLTRIEAGVFVVHMKSGFADKHRYHHVTRVGNVTSWDKAVFLMGRIFPRHARRFYWVIEDDVFIPTIHAFHNLHYKAMSMKADFVAREIYERFYGEIDPDHPWLWEWHGQSLTKMFNYPFYHGLCSASGFSMNMVNALTHFVDVVGQVEYLEAWFYTVALRSHNLTTLISPVLDKIRYRDNHTCADVAENLLDRWFHPVKDVSFIDHCINSGEWNATVTDYMNFAEKDKYLGKYSSET